MSSHEGLRVSRATSWELSSVWSGGRGSLTQGEITTRGALLPVAIGMITHGDESWHNSC
jgi:hypothetical protein